MSQPSEEELLNIIRSLAARCAQLSMESATKEAHYQGVIATMRKTNVESMDDRLTRKRTT